METKTGESVGVATDDSQEDISAELARRESILRQASEIIGDSNRLFNEQVSALLEVVRKAVGTEYATRSYVDNDTHLFEAVDMPSEVRLQAGETVPLAELPNCKKVVETEQALVLQNAGAEAPESADPTRGISSYTGVPVFVGDEIYGTFCYYGKEPRAEEFSERDLTFVEILSNWVSAELERRERKRSLRACSLEQPFPAN